MNSRKARPRPTTPRREMRAGWVACRSHAGADTAARCYIARCREDFRPEGYFVQTKQEGGEIKHYPVLIVKGDALRSMHARSGFKSIQA